MEYHRRCSWHIVDPICPEERDFVLRSEVLIDLDAGQRGCGRHLIDHGEVVDIAGTGRNRNQILNLQRHRVQAIRRNHVAWKLRTNRLAIDHLVAERIEDRILRILPSLRIGESPSGQGPTEITAPKSSGWNGRRGTGYGGLISELIEVE